MPLFARLSAFTGSALMLMLAAAAPAETQDLPPIGGGYDGPVIPLVDWETRMNIDERLQPLGDDLMGDRIDPHTGSLDFLHTDVALPGNSRLEVALRRRNRQGKLYGNDAAEFGDWEYVVPRIRVVTAEAQPWTGNRCSDPFSDQFENVWLPTRSFVRPQEYSNGIMLEVGGSSEALLENPRNARWPSNATHVTNSNWYFTCLGAGNFLGHAPDGTTYRFDRHIVRDAMPTSMYGEAPLYRDTHILAATEVTDQHGNWVRYDYDTDGRLTRIHANDGRSITLSYNGASRLVSSVQANGRSWTYSYRAGTGEVGPWVAGQYLSPGSVLDSVTLPDGRAWDFTLDGMQIATPPNRFCFAATSLSMTHPSGATGEFELLSQSHRARYSQQKSIPSFCPLPDVSLQPGSPGGSWPLVDDTSVVVLSVTEKTLTGPGLPAASWIYTYENDTATDTSLADPTNWTEIDGPSGHVTVYHLWREQPEGGALIRQETREAAGGSILETSETEYVTEGSFGDSGPDTSLAGYDPSSLPRHVALQTVNRGGDLYSTEYTYITDDTDLDYSFGRPVSIRKWSNLPGATQRLTETEYEHNTTHWILGLPQRVERNNLEFFDVTYNGLGLPVAVESFGVVTETRGYNSDGTPAWSRDALNRQTSFANFHRGQPQSITRADSSSVQLVVDDNGWVTSVTNARGITNTYAYNDAGWLTGIDRPSPFYDTSISYSSLSNGLVQTVNRGSIRITTTHDAFYRPVHVRRQPILNGGSDIYSSTEYDAAGRVIFTSMPSDVATPVDGTSTSYDALGRVTQTVQNVSPYATTSTVYLSDNRIQITDPEGNVTTSTRMGFGSPDDGFTTLIAHPMGLFTQMGYDNWGNLSTARQYGSHNGYSVDVTQSYYYDTRLRLCRHSTLETLDTLYQYDDANQLVASASGQLNGAGCASLPAIDTVVRTYDSLGRLDQVDYPDAAPDIDLDYDANGNLISAVRGGTAWTYQYDVADNLTREELVIDNFVFASDYHWDADNFLLEQTTPSGRTINYRPNAHGQAKRLRINGFDYINNGRYDESGLPWFFDYGNGLNFGQGINSRDLVSRIRVYDDLGTNHVDLRYSHDANGRVTSIDDDAVAGQDRSFTYDGLNRLVSATGPWGNATYDYDPLGNLRERIIGSRTVEIRYGGRNRVDEVRDSAQGPGWLDYTYDTRGNTLTNGRLSFTYDRSEQPVAMTGDATGTYIYDAHRRRVKQVIDGETIYSVYGADGVLRYRYNATAGETTDYLRFAGQTVARLTDSSAGTEVVYTHNDHLGSPVAATDANGAILWREDYAPFGEARQRPITNADSQGYTGHIADAGTDLVYMQARYYDPAIGRFLSNDPVGFGQGGPAYFNRYAYVGNSPLNATDPSGEALETVWDAANLAIGVASFVDNVSQGNFGAATVDAVGIIADGAATVTPFVPGGAGTAIRAGRTARALSNAGDAAGDAAAARRGGNPCSCFEAGTAVTTQKGDVNIETLNVGDLVLARDPETGETTWSPVTATFMTGIKPIWALTVRTVDGVEDVHFVTDDHPYWVHGRGWIETKDLHIGDRLDTADGQGAEVISFEPTGRDAPVYNFSVADVHTYFVGDVAVLVHNRGCGDIPSGNLSDMNRVGRGRIRQMERNGFNAHDIKEEMGANSRQDLFTDRDGNIFVGNKDGTGEAEWTGRNVNEWLDD